MAKYKNQDNDNYLLNSNLLGIETHEKLEEAEALSFSFRAGELELQEYKDLNFTKEAFKNLHKQLFQDIYPFAGEFRNVQLMKQNTRFYQVQFLETNASYLFNKLNNEPQWSTLEEAAERLAFFKSELNMLHPYREGNGRTIRIFIHACALSKGFEWNYEELNQKTYIEAMIQSVTNVSTLRDLFLETLQEK